MGTPLAEALVAAYLEHASLGPSRAVPRRRGTSGPFWAAQL